MEVSNDQNMWNVSVIVPVFNRAHLIERTLDSILNQKRRPDQLIIVDNQSTDNSVEVIRNWLKQNSNAGIKFSLLSETQKGAAAARQKGFKAADGEYVIFFDSDDEMRPELISSALEAIRQNPDVDVVCWKVRYNFPDGSKRIMDINPARPLTAHLISSMLRTQGYIARKDFLEKTGAWCKKLTVWDDFELGFRILKHNPKIIGIKKILVEIHAQPISITGTDFSSKAGLWEMSLNEIRKESSALPSDIKALVDVVIRYRETILAALYAKEGNEDIAVGLLKKALEGTSKTTKRLLLFAYHYTKSGGRGAWRIIGKFLLKLAK